jgi:hypothetical protein
MRSPPSNIEVVARAVCAEQLVRGGAPIRDLAADVDRYWHCIAAQIEAGIFDESGRRLRPFDFDAELSAYRNWVSRHRAA